jgi:hypothetical protein
MEWRWGAEVRVTRLTLSLRACFSAGALRTKIRKLANEEALTSGIEVSGQTKLSGALGEGSLVSVMIGFQRGVWS